MYNMQNVIFIIYSIVSQACAYPNDHYEAHCCSNICDQNQGIDTKEYYRKSGLFDRAEISHSIPFHVNSCGNDGADADQTARDVNEEDR